MARRSFGPRPVRRTKRETVWLEFSPAQFTIAAASTALALFSLNAGALALRPFTIVRTRGLLFYRSDQTGASENYGGNVGISVVSDQASAIGITAVPTPVTDMGSDLWFMMEELAGRFENLTSVGAREVGKEHRFDSKAMRKVDVGEDIFVSAETSSADSSLIVRFSARMLVKLH